MSSGGTHAIVATLSILFLITSIHYPQSSLKEMLGNIFEVLLTLHI